MAVHIQCPAVTDSVIKFWKVALDIDTADAFVASTSPILPAVGFVADDVSPTDEHVFAPPSMMFPLESNTARSPDVRVPFVVAKLVVLPERVPDATALVPLPINGVLAVNVVAPVPPWLTGAVPVSVDVPSARVNPAPVAPPVRVPVLVRDDASTFDASVAPLNVPAGAITAFVPAAVMSPLPLTVKFGIAVEDPQLPVFVFTVAKVVASEPAVVVMSPVSAGKFAAGSASRFPSTPALL